MKFIFHPEASHELNHAIDFYEERQEKLGTEFMEEVYATIQRIIEFPNNFPRHSKNTRKCFTNRFPFTIIYQIKPEEILIIAVAHQSRKPGYWKERF